MKYGIILASLLLASCGFTPQGDLVRNVVREKGAQAFDEGLANSVWFMCNAASVGSIRRTFADRMEAYNAICTDPPLKLD